MTNHPKSEATEQKHSHDTMFLISHSKGTDYPKYYSCDKCSYIKIPKSEATPDKDLVERVEDAVGADTAQLPKLISRMILLCQEVRDENLKNLAFLVYTQVREATIKLESERQKKEYFMKEATENYFRKDEKIKYLGTALKDERRHSDEAIRIINLAKMALRENLDSEQQDDMWKKIHKFVLAHGKRRK